MRKWQGSQPTEAKMSRSNHSEVQDQLPLQDRKTILMPLPARQEPSPEEKREHESAYRHVKKIMEERQDD